MVQYCNNPFLNYFSVEYTSVLYVKVSNPYWKIYNRPHILLNIVELEIL